MWCSHIPKLKITFPSRLRFFPPLPPSREKPWERGWLFSSRLLTAAKLWVPYFPRGLSGSQMYLGLLLRENLNLKRPWNNPQVRWKRKKARTRYSPVQTWASMFFGKSLVLWEMRVSASHPRGGGVLPYIRYIHMCRPKGYGFWAVLVLKQV